MGEDNCSQHYAKLNRGRKGGCFNYLGQQLLDGGFRLRVK